jgi:hypothetical protein
MPSLVSAVEIGGCVCVCVEENKNEREELKFLK